ncbi:MAG TPA: universal stress protein [Solirubrobacteraceae bacterium]|nr:universal stress protein [Solirubrobacteraceae bacterium]
MSANVIVSYDGSDNDDDGLALARLLAAAGATLALAYVRHSHEFDEGREHLAQYDAERRLELGATWLGDPDIARHVIVTPSTSEGLRTLAESEGAALIVFGSDYRTPLGHAEPGAAAQNLLEGGSRAVAVAAAGLRADPDAKIASIGVLTPEGDTAAQQTAEALAGKLGAQLADSTSADLIVVGSQASGNRITLSGAIRSKLDSSRGSTLVVPSGQPVLL